MPTAETVRRRRRLLAAARAVVRQRYGDPDLELRDVAEAVGVSTRQLQRVFREQGGEDVRSYLLGVRMREAHRLLTREPNPVPSVRAAVRVGYSGTSGLRAAFRRFYGYPPSAVQRDPPEELYAEVNPVDRDS